MLLLAATILVVAITVYFTLAVRPQDLPAVEPPSPTRHLEERKAAIYENLRDLQFEYRVGKLSDADYQQTKTDLQKELASVLAEVDRLKEELGQTAPAPKSKPARKDFDPLTCPHCNAHFEKELKFCGECGKPMKAVKV